MSTPRLARVALAGALLLSATGCSAQVTTDVTVTGAQSAAVHVAATFTDEAAKAITDHPATRAQLLGVFTDRTGHAPQVQATPGRLVVAQDLTYAQLRGSADLLGVSDATLTGAGDQTTLTLHLVPPARLAAAVRTATAGQADGPALAQTMLRSTRVSVRVTFPGGVTAVRGAGATRDGGTVTLTRTADATGSTVLAVSGDPSPNRLPYLLGGAGLLAAGAGLLARRRRRG